MYNLPLPPNEIRCLAYGLQADGLATRRKTCPRADECAAHLTIRHDRFDGAATIVKRRCEGQELTSFVAVEWGA